MPLDLALSLPSNEKTMLADDLKTLLTDLLRQYRDRVDFLALRVEEAEGTNIVLRGEQIETLSEGLAIGGHVRACHQGGWGFASFNRLASLPERIEEAIAAAKLVGDEETLLAPIDPVQTVCQLPLTGTNPRHIALSDKKALCDRYNQILKSVNPRITTTHVRYGDTQQRMILATSEGTLIEQSWCDLEMRFSATARDGETVQIGRETTGSRNGYEDLTQLDLSLIHI